MATFNKFNSFVEHLAEGVHNFSSDATSTITVALCTTLPVATNTILADITTQISYTNLSSRICTINASSQTSGTYKLILNDLVLTASGAVGPFQYAVLYNDDPTSPTDPLIGWYDYGSSISLANLETLTLDFDQVNGMFTLA
jgi:hypothetical protein